MPHYLYILHSPSSDKFYIGQSSNLEYRLKMHNELSTSSFTAKYRPWQLKTKLEVSSRSVAMSIEKYLKKKPKSFIRKLIHDFLLQQYILNRFDRSDD